MVMNSMEKNMIAAIRKLNRVFVAFAIAVCVAACSSTGDAINKQAMPEASSQEAKNIAFITRYLTALGTEDYPYMVDNLHAENYVRSRQEFENLLDNAAGDPVLLKDMKGVRAAFPDRTNTVTQILGKGDFVAATYRTRATHSGNLFGIPATGKVIDIEGSAIFKVRDGKVEEAFLMADETALLRQLEVSLPKRSDTN